MARRKSLIRIPFIKLKINRGTIISILGLLMIGFTLVLLLSYIKGFFPDEGAGKMLYQINQWLMTKFGGLSIFVPFIVLMFSGHFFNSKKLKFIKLNISGGIILVFVALLGTFQSGEYGKLIFDNLTLDFTIVGSLLIFAILFTIGLVLFLDTSIDVFLIFVFQLFKSALTFIRNYFFRSFDKKRSFDFEDKKKDTRFIEDEKIQEKPKIQLPLPLTKTQSPVQLSSSMSSSIGGINIKPLVKNPNTTWIYPPLSLLNEISQKEAERGDVNKNADVIEKTLDSFGLRAKVTEVNRGPAVTQYALKITEGTRLAKITALSNDLALALAATTGQVRIEAPIPGRSLVGIEIPNIRPELVTLKKMLTSPVFAGNNDPLLVPLGLDVSGTPQATSISKMPHALIAGTTGSGKSVILNSWICSFLFRTKPEELRMILVDPKRVELTVYNGVPHLLTPVIVDTKEIISALKWTVAEMENRLKEFAKVGARDITGYNIIEGVEKKPFIIFVIDELADLMIFAAGDVEDLITRIAQLARATGIHLVLATQRPSVDVITGLMKANIPTRLAFNVSSMIDSRVIIDMPGAEKLLGRGDMLFLPPDQAKPRRIQGPFITVKEVENLVKFLKAQVPEVHYTTEVTDQEVSINGRGGTMMVGSGGGEHDTLFDSAVEIIMQHDKASASLLQRRLAIGYARAARILDQLEAAGYVSPAEGSKPREVIKRPTHDLSQEN